MRTVLRLPRLQEMKLEAWETDKAFLPVLKKNLVPDDFKYLAVAESGLSQAVSPAKAVGFWQLLKGTAGDYGLTVNSEVDERYHVGKSTEVACRYLIDSYKIPGDRAELIYQGTDVKRFTSNEERKRDSLKRYPLPENASPVLGNVGMFEERKGQTVLLEAVSKLVKDCFPDLHLIFVGEGPDEQILKDRVREMGLDNNITFFPFTREPMYVFERIDILVLSSLYKEGLPNVLLEAMSMNVPVVSSKMAGVPEIIKDGKTGYMVEPGKSGQLADAISKLWSDRTVYKKIGRNGRKLMEESFNKEAQFAEFLKYFHRITGK